MNKLIFVLLLSLSLAKNLRDLALSKAYAESISNMYSRHNYYRALHKDTPSITRDSTIEAVAQAYAEKIAKAGVMEHSGNKKYGENIFLTMSSGPDPKFTGTDGVDRWYKEISKYDYKKPGWGDGSAGHFTQVIWKSSTKVGCGAAVGRYKSNGTNWYAVFVVCNYYPPGNYSNEYTKNVMPLK